MFDLDKTDFDRIKNLTYSDKTVIGIHLKHFKNFSIKYFMINSLKLISDYKLSMAEV